MMPALLSWNPVSQNKEQNRKISNQHWVDICRQHFRGIKDSTFTQNTSIIIIHFVCLPTPGSCKPHQVCQQANFGVCLLSFESGEGQGVCPAAQSGHYHLNRSPWMPSGVTLATVKTIVPAVSVSVCVCERVSVCERERLLCALQRRVWPKNESKCLSCEQCTHRANVSSFSGEGQVQWVRHLSSCSWHKQRNANQYSWVIWASMSNLPTDRFSERLLFDIYFHPWYRARRIQVGRWVRLVVSPKNGCIVS